MKYHTSTRITKVLLFVLTALTLNSCSSYYYCSVSGFGSTPIEKKYFIEPIDSTLVNDLEFLEYASILRNRLNESGYMEETPQKASLCIRFGYYIGDKELVGTSTSSGSISLSNGKTTANSTAKANGSANTNLYGNSVSTTAKASGSSSTVVKTKQQTNTVDYSSTTAEYTKGIGCYIEAIKTTNMSPVWTVEVKDIIRSYGSWDNTTFRKVMPWMIASAQYYFGKSGEETIKIKKKEGVENKGLVWPY